MSQKKARIAYLGSLPPPIGGISMDLQRLTGRLVAEGYDYTVYDLLNKKTTYRDGTSEKIGNRWWWMLKYIFTAREDLICCHHIDWRLRVVVGLMTLLGHKTLVSIAGPSLNDAWREGGWLRKKIIAFSLRRYSFVIAHNPVIKQFCLSLGVKPERIKIIYGFIPPAVKDEEVAQIPEEEWDFIKSHTPIISVNAYKIVFYQGQDLYGLDLCVDLCANLKSDYPHIGLVFCLPNVGDYDYLHKMQQRIKEKDIENNFLLVTQSYQFYPFLMKSQVFLRPTNTDGDATSLREALFFGVPSVASDVFPRPEGTILFESRNIEDFTLKVRDVLQNYEQNRRKLETLKPEDNSKELIKVYQGLIGNAK
jgi:glycosyltransferase involved in cell wall biosynthesis